MSKNASSKITSSGVSGDRRVNRNITATSAIKTEAMTRISRPSGVSRYLESVANGSLSLARASESVSFCMFASSTPKPQYG